MIGHHKFNYNDKVMFVINGIPIKGYVYIIDRYGVFEDSSSVYYDIMSEDETMLYKHIKEDNIKKLS